MKHRYVLLFLFDCQHWQCLLHIKFSDLALLCDSAQTGELMHLVESFKFRAGLFKALLA